MTGPDPLRTPRIAVIGLAGVAVVWALTYMSYPLGGDQGIFAWVGQVIVHGGMPYRDAWIGKGPLVPYLFAGLEQVFGMSPVAIRAFDLVVVASALIVCGRGLREMGLSRLEATGWGLLVFIGWSTFGFWNTAQPDGWITWALAAASMPFLRRDPAPPGAYARYGLVIGLGLLVKPLYALAFLVTLAAEVGRRGTQPGARLVRLAASVGAAAAPVLLCLAWFQARGALEPMLDAYLRFSVESSRLGWGRFGLLGMLPKLAGDLAWVVACLPLAAIGLAILLRESPRVALAAAAWAGWAVAIPAIQSRWHSVYQLAGLVPPVALLAGLGFHRLLSQEAPRLRRITAAALLAVVLLLLLGPAAKAAAAWAAWLRSGRPLAEYHARFIWGASFSAGDSERAAEYVAARVPAGGSVLVWENPLVNALADRPSPSRFAYYVPLTGGPLTPRRLAYRAEFLSALRRRPPALVLVDTLTLPRGRPANLGESFPELLELFERRYRLADTVTRYLVLTPRL